MLARTRGLSEQAAFTQLAGYLTGALRAPPASRPPAVSACEQLRDLQARFPQYRDACPFGSRLFPLTGPGPRICKTVRV